MIFTNGKAVISLNCVEFAVGTTAKPMDVTASVFEEMKLPYDQEINALVSSDLEHLSQYAHEWADQGADVGTAKVLRIVFEEVIGSHDSINKDEAFRDERLYEAKKRFVYNVWQGDCLSGDSTGVKRITLDDAESDLEFLSIVNRTDDFTCLGHYHPSDDVWITPEEYMDLWNDFCGNAEQNEVVRR